MVRRANGEIEVEVEEGVLVSAAGAAPAKALVTGEAIDYDWPVGLGVKSSAKELPLYMRVPVVFDLIVCPAGQSPRD